MKCSFNYKGRTFQSEADLDEFLLISKELKGTDSVFSKWSKQLDSVYRKIQESNNSAFEAEKNGKVVVTENNGEPEDTDNLRGTGNYKSITELIHEIRVKDNEGEDHPLFPIFEGDNYWNNQYEKYRNGNFDNKVAAQIPFIEDLLTKVGNQYQPVKDEATLKKIRARMEDVWKQQALCGDVVHALFSDFYKGKINKKRFVDLTDDELKVAFQLKILESYYSKFKDYLTNDSIIDSVITEARKLDTEIRRKYGDDCMILSEKRIVGQGIFGTDAIPIVGKMDLFVITKTGKMAILDFKCSPKEYTENNTNEDPSKYDPAKVLTFKYLLAAYRRLLASIGVTDSESNIDLGVIPLQFLNYHLDYNTKKVQFDGISSMANSIQILSNTSATTGGNLYSTIESNLEQIFPTSNYLDNTTTENLLSSIQEEEKILFKEMKRRKDMTDGDITEYIKKHGGIYRNSITNNWEFKPYKLNDKEIYRANGKKTQEEAEVEIFNKVKNRFAKKDDYVPTTTESIRKSFKEAFRDETPIDFKGLAKKISNNNEDPLYTQKLLEKYNNPSRYTLISSKDLDPILNQLGILMFKNKISGLIDIVKISNYFDLTLSARLGGENSNDRTTLFGTFLSDGLVNSDSNSLALQGVVGNVELMEVMLLLNKLPNLFVNNTGVGSIQVINPGAQRGITATNEQLLYNFRRLCKLGDIKNNFIDKHGLEGKIKMADLVSICRSTFNELINQSNLGNNKILNDAVSEVRSCISDFDNLGSNPAVLKEKLIKIDKILTDNYPNLQKEGSIQDELSNPEYKLHRDILFAISELSGVKLLQLLEDHSKWGISMKGVSGTMIDNPGTLQSKTLNEFTDLVTKAYQNVRDDVVSFNQELRKRVEALKEAKGFGLAKLYTVGNQVKELYINMFDQTSDDLLFVNPWDNAAPLSNEEREFLKFALLKINDNRFKEDMSKLPDLIKANPVKYLRVPLVKGDLTSEVAVRDGWLNYIRSRFMRLTPKRLKEQFNKVATNLLNDQLQERIENGDMWEAIVSFDGSENGKDGDEYRQSLLTNEALGGKSYFEHNIETLLLKHTSAYKMAGELNNIFPILRALTLHLNLQGSILNDKFQNDLEYIFRYVRTRIHNYSIENRNKGVESAIADITKSAMSVASKLALAFNPRQLYQIPDGIWKDIQLYIKNNPDEETPFTKEGLSFGFKKAFKDLGHFGNKFSMTELLNLQYGFNDMDANNYINRIKTDNTGLLYHFWNVGFRFASRPDYYNRMTLFYALMYKDGSHKAHKMIDDKLVYNWKEDGRFEAFAKGDKSNMERYNKLRSLFITIGRQLEEEGTKNPDGTLYKMDLNKPYLPKAYTNKEIEGMKALSDRIYGYYSHEKKSLIHSYLAGAVFMQMNTYWSAKKNQYLQERSYTQEGDWRQYEEIVLTENGTQVLKYYWKVDEDGDLIPTTENTGMPVLVWKGRPLEGIFLTILETAKAFAGKSNLTSKSGVSGMWDIYNNEDIDPQIRRLYSANLRQLFSDLFIWLLVGELFLGSIRKTVGEEIKASGNKNAGTALTNASMFLGTSILLASTQDANFFKSIGGRVSDVNPFVIQLFGNLYESASYVGEGKRDLYDFLIRSNGATNSTKPLWDYVKISTLGRKIGEHDSE